MQVMAPLAPEARDAPLHVLVLGTEDAIKRMNDDGLVAGAKAGLGVAGVSMRNRPS